MKSDFEPLNLQDASLHVDWLINKTEEIYKIEKKSLWDKIVGILLKIF